MKFSEQQTRPEVLGAFMRYIAERMFNVNKMFKTGGGRVDKAELVLGDLVVVEAKLDALILLMEEQGHDMTKYQDYLLEACKMGQANAINIRKQFEAMK